jgi:glycosyltransferase involved in cell wall biosynthesis
MVSVIVPTHNRQKLLEQKLLALAGQQGEFEVIVVADGCTDDTPRFLNSYQASYPLRVIYADGAGTSAARNRGARAAQGDLLLFSDDDVLPKTGWVEGHCQAHTAPQRVAVGHLALPPGLRGCGAAELLGPRVYWWNITGNSTSLSKALFEEVGGYDESFSGYGGEDPDLGYRLLKAGAQLVFAGSAKATHEAWDFPPKMLSKARSAGAAHLRVWHKHQDPHIAWALGVHPALLAVKLAVLPWAKQLLGSRGDFELAYAWGAWGAYQQR